MLISSPCVVGLTWQLRDSQGVSIDELTEPVEFFVGGDDLLAKVEEALIGQEAGFTTSLYLEPDQAFGDYDPALVFFEERSHLPDGIDIGMQFDGVPEGAVTEGMPADAIYTVTEAYPAHVVLDGNHPLAGIALRLELAVHEVREATPEEVEAASVGQPAFTVMNTAPAGARLH